VTDDVQTQRRSAPPARRRARTAASVVVVVALVALTACSSKSTDRAGSATTTAVHGLPGGVVTIQMAIVGDPGNPSVGVIQSFGGPKGKFVDPPVPPKDTGIYANCSKAPAAPPPCLMVGAVGYTYGIGEFELTVSQYVTFLNTVDREGKNPHDLYIDDMNPTVWPKYGSVAYTADAATGSHYSIAYLEWADKPFNFGDFRRGARFANSLTNGTVLSATSSTSGPFKYVTYKVRLSPRTEQGMYDMNAETPKRTGSTGFVLPSNDEWVKAAYYDPHHGGTDSYWAYPTGPFNPPNPTVLNPTTGDVVNPTKQPLATYNPNDPNSSVDTPGSPPGAAPTWCPAQAGPNCNEIFPADFPPELAQPSQFMGNVSTIGQAKTPSPWGTYDQGGNVVEVLDTLAPQPPGYHFLRDWRYYHGGVANAPAYQVEISAFGYFPGDPQAERVYPWLGFRIGVIGTPK
jgi:hypothetical protein